MKTRETLRQGLVLALLAVMPLAGLSTGCGGDDDDDGPTGPGNTATVTAAEFTVFAGANAGLVWSVGDAAFRVIAALSGGEADGVSFATDDGETYSGTVAMDLDGDGVRESTFSGAAAFIQLFDKEGEFAPVAQLSLAGVDSPLLGSAGGTLEVEVIGGGEADNPILYLHSADLGLTTADGVAAACDEMHVTLDLTFPQSPYYGGYFAFQAGGLDLECCFEEDGAGGWLAMITGDGVDVTIDP